MSKCLLQCLIGEKNLLTINLIEYIRIHLYHWILKNIFNNMHIFNIFPIYTWANNTKFYNNMQRMIPIWRKNFLKTCICVYVFVWEKERKKTRENICSQWSHSENKIESEERVILLLLFLFISTVAESCITLIIKMIKIKRMFKTCYIFKNIFLWSN